MRSPTAVLTAGLLAASLLAGCSDSGPTTSPPRPAAPTDPTPTDPTPGDARDSRQASPPTRSPEPAASPPPWLGRRILPTTATGFGEVRPTPPRLRNRGFTLPDTVPPLPGRGFAARIRPAPRAVIERSTWRPACPVHRSRLAWLRLTFWGFDHRRHTGELLVHEEVARDLVSVFSRLYAVRFPLEELSIVTRRELDAPPTGDGNTTTAYVCRPTTGGTSYSQHAYGLAVDVNSFQNPYVSGRLVLPELASSYLQRDHRRPGMIAANGPVVRAFAAIGWEWGGYWRTLKDYQHFSATGR